MLFTMEVEQEEEVMGHPGHVRDMIARFTQMAPRKITPPLAKTETKRDVMHNGATHDDVDNDVTDNCVVNDDHISCKPIIRDVTLGKTINNNNNDRQWNDEMKNENDSCNVIMDFRKKLRPVGNTLNLYTTPINGVRTDAENEENNATFLNGSEPSLVSRNSNRSAATTASKRTLVSQDTNNSPQQQNSSSQPTLLEDNPDTTMPGTTTADSSLDSSLDTTPKTPSYMKISCALSGYNRYYTSPKQEAKLKVIKLSDQNSSHSSLSSTQSDSSEIKTNGDLRLKGGVPVRIQYGTVKSHANSNGVEKERTCDVANNINGVVLNGADHDHHQQTMVIVNGASKGGLEENGEGQFVTKASVSLDTPPATPPEVSNLQWEDGQDLQSTVSTPSPSKDGHYYFPVVDGEVARIQVLCSHCTGDLEDNSVPEEAKSNIRAAIGKSNLLINKKFQQFRGLCESNINQSEDEKFTTTVADLAGFWDMVSLQIDDINTMFKDIENMRRSDWAIVTKSPARQTAPKSIKSPRSKDSSSTPSKSAKSAKSVEAAKARDEARRRLLAAKRAGRQRKSSQSDKDEIEIFVA